TIESVNITGTPGSSSVGGTLDGVLQGAGDGRFVGHMKGAASDVTSPGGHTFELWHLAHASEAEAKQRMRKHRYAAPLSKPTVAGNVIDFGDVAWPGRTLSI